MNTYLPMVTSANQDELKRLFMAIPMRHRAHQQHHLREHRLGRK
ncbi:hypothetical protein ACOT10_13870 [Providencia manganoxydans]